ncbi:Tetraspanin-19 [Dendrobium catenatum]|uniref:Tetraspanin-19 n=1 Tax=Dendrobium catenatum TaxID=906689 RepID=A0A2I0WC19_9ASPA|nr:Tetraspanin-19 [Dendrobium catenatum]
MAEWARACFQSTLKIVNSVIGLVGMAMILYSLWMVRAWFREMSELSPGFSGRGNTIGDAFNLNLQEVYPSSR